MICTKPDDYTQEKWLSEARWIAVLSTGEQVLQDDDRPGVEPKSAWLRLGEHVKKTGSKIVELSIRFRDEPAVTFPSNAEGYFFRKSMGAFLFSDTSYGFYVVGVLQEGTLLVQKWKVPEMVLVEEEIRDPADDDKVGPSLIRG